MAINVGLNLTKTHVQPNHQLIPKQQLTYQPRIIYHDKYSSSSPLVSQEHSYRDRTIVQ